MSKHMNAEVLVDPKSRQTEIDISRLEHDEAEHLLRSMMLIRHSEHKLAQMKKEGMIGGLVHLGVGQEAIAAGMSQHLNASDRVFGAHRSHAHLLAINPDCHKLLPKCSARPRVFRKAWEGPCICSTRIRAFTVGADCLGNCSTCGRCRIRLQTPGQ